MRRRLRPRIVHVRVSVKVKSRFVVIDEPHERFETMMRQILAVVNVKGRRVRDKNVKITPVPRAVQHERGRERGDLGAHFIFGVLKLGTIVVADRTFKPSDEQTFVLDDARIDVLATFGENFFTAVAAVIAHHVK